MTSKNKEFMNNQIKCVVVGDGGVGKTCMLVSYATNKFPKEHVPTVFDNYAVTVTVGSYKYHVGLFDTAGQEEYDRLRLLAYPGTDIFLVCFSITNPSSYKNVEAMWKPELSQFSTTTPILLVGTQLDMRTDPGVINNLARTEQRPVSTKQGMRMAKKIGAVSYVECSALTQRGLKEVFDLAINTVLLPKKSKTGCFSLRSRKK